MPTVIRNAARAVWNLISNAFKGGSSGGNLTVDRTDITCDQTDITCDQSNYP